MTSLVGAPPHRHLLLRTTSSSEEFDADIDLAVVEVTPALAQAILGRRRQVIALAADRQFQCASWWSCDCIFGHAGRLAELRPDVHQSLDDQGWALFDGDVVDLGFKPERTAVDRVSVNEQHVWWSASPKHCDLVVETLPVLVAVLVEAVAQLLEGKQVAA